ncbi:tetratricopeptide repeat protein [Aggregicoccus sp. 17bor-14]|uniref:zinc-ribbon domain-containing protein n=1 Tax=Myxococcaceae TaxID=31 RepID=UPI00129CF950|nr:MULTISPECIES: zinc-ribbon domain-containing protein [Myxococcaceae]MBF5043730.1 zinc-ribbon domain-containing protein [Simulacricoccus sp. 17bor-14]MRI89486.1 tetratricopeptide repeat protein [Aggregicoccus sp. 17bor-14]
MDVRCERCKTEYEFDDARITEAGVTVRCTTCQHVFMVKKKALVVTVPVKAGGGAEAGSATPLTAAPTGGASAAPEKTREWRVRQASGTVLTFRELTTLQKWIVERKVTRDDEISLTGESWKRLGNIAELASFFQVVDEAQRAAGLAAASAQAAPQPPPAAPPPRPATAPPPAAEPLEAAAPPPARSEPLAEAPFRREAAAVRSGSAERRAPEQRSGARPLLWLLVLAVLGAGAYAAYTQLWEPRESAAPPVAPPPPRPAARPAEAPDASPAPAAAATAAPEAAGTTEATGATEDGGAPAQGAAAPGALAAAGAADAGLAEASAAADAGSSAAEDAGVRVATPAPPAGAGVDGGSAAAQGKDFATYIAQGDRLRMRERPDSALFAYARAQELEPTRPEPHVGRGLAYLDQGRFVFAERSFQQALRLDPKSGAALMGLAETYRAQGQKANAQRYYEQYLQVMPDGPDARAARNALERLKKD